MKRTLDQLGHAGVTYAKGEAKHLLFFASAAVPMVAGSLGIINSATHNCLIGWPSSYHLALDLTHLHKTQHAIDQAAILHDLQPAHSRQLLSWPRSDAVRRERPAEVHAAGTGGALVV